MCVRGGGGGGGEVVSGVHTHASWLAYTEGFNDLYEGAHIVILSSMYNSSVHTTNASRHTYTILRVI